VTVIRRLLIQKVPASQSGFRWRSTESSRLEELSDAVMAFALTLLVVSLEVPRTFDDLLSTIRGFAAFALCFALLIVIWYEHYTYFRRYGLKDTPVLIWNTVLLFLIVFYVYPLKFLFTLFINDLLGASLMVSLPGGAMAPMIRQEQLPELYLIFSLGWTGVWLVFVLLYRHALRQREQLGLSPLEVFDTRASIGEDLAAAGVGVASISLVAVGASSISGFVYLLMLPLTWAIKRRNALRRLALEGAAAEK
jgi:hypothetical protein